MNSRFLHFISGRIQNLLVVQSLKEFLVCMLNGANPENMFRRKITCASGLLPIKNSPSAAFFARVQSPGILSDLGKFLESAKEIMSLMGRSGFFADLGSLGKRRY